EAAGGDVLLHELGHAVRVGGNAAGPAAALEEDRAGRDGVDADSFRCKPEGHVLGVADHGRLHRVVEEAATGLAAPDRDDVDDAAAAGGAHVGQDGAGSAHGGQQIKVVDCLPGVVVLTAGAAAGVVHKDVDAAIALRGGANEAFYAVGAR